ncbi:19145_t:CDS:2, partial [Cetraspora pellucida]
TARWIHISAIYEIWLWYTQARWEENIIPESIVGKVTEGKIKRNLQALNKLQKEKGIRKIMKHINIKHILDCSLEHVNKSNPSWDEQVAQETKKLKKITNMHKEEVKKNRIYVTKENSLLVEKSDNNIATLMEQDNNILIHNEEVIEDNTLNEEITKTTWKQQLKITIPGIKFHTTISANKEENSYLQDDISITNSTGLQENDLIQKEQNGPLLSLMKIDNNKRNSTSSKDKDLSPDPVLAPCDKLAALYLNSEPQAENKNTDKTLPIME